VTSWGAFFEKDGPTVTWTPTKAEVLVGGDVGVTFGEWVHRARSSDGRTIETRGEYTTAWLRQTDGTWRVIFDIGSTRP
jgi:ketosteroid isomerase-like protein